MKSIAHDKNKNTAFEAFRALAVTMVLVGHFAALSKDLPLLAKNVLYSFNSYGLAIFFVISGFLLSASFSSLLKKQDQRFSAVKFFFIKRILRIYPAYLISLIIFSAILTNFFKYPVYWFDILVHFFNIHNLFEGFSRSINGVYWTLAVEFQWYLFAPMLILLFIKTNTKILIALFAASIFFSVFMRFSAIHEYFSRTITQTEMIRLGCDQLYIHLFNFLIGIIIYRYRDQKIKLPSLAVWILLLSVISIGYFRTYLNLMYHSEQMFRYMALLDYTGIVILGLLLFVFMKIDFNGTFYRTISFISLISYSLYIYHFPILHYVVNFNLAWYFTFPLFFAFAVFIAAISYYMIEAPFLKYSSKLGKNVKLQSI